jgi:hypothetical protein
MMISKKGNNNMKSRDLKLRRKKQHNDSSVVFGMNWKRNRKLGMRSVSLLRFQLAQIT